MTQPVNYQRLEPRPSENLDRNLQKQFMHDRQAEMFDPNGFSFNGVHIKRLKDKPKAELSAQNPTRKALNYRMERDKSFFDSRSSMLDSVVKERNRRVKVDPNACGELKIEKKVAIFSEHRVDDFESTIDELTQSEQQAEKFGYDTRYFYNSGLNGLSYTEDGKKVTVDSCVCSPWDRSGLDLHSARLSETKDKKSIFYAGRPDTDKRLELQGIDIFLNELATGHNKGFVRRGDNVIELHYIIDSLSTSTEGVGQIAALGGSLDEGKSLEWERAAIKKARENNKPIKVVHNGKTYRVLLRPTQVHNSVSFFASYNFLEFSVEDQINRNGYKKLVKLYQSRLQSGHIESKWQNVGKEIIDELGKHKDSTKIDAGMRIAMIDMLSKICDLPIVHHCKSVVDRTTGAAAASIVNQMLLDGKFALVEGSFIKTIESDTELYKHLFLRALKSQLPVSSDVRSAVNIDGTLNTKRVLPGLEWHTGHTMVAFGFTSLMPKEALRTIPTWIKVVVLAGTCLAFIVTILLSPVVRAVTWTFSGSKYCFKIPIILPTWLKPKYSYDHHSYLLSEGGTRPVLNGPHNSDIKKKIKKKDPTVGHLLAKKGELVVPALRQRALDLLPKTVFSLTKAQMEEFYIRAEDTSFTKDFYRHPGFYWNEKLVATSHSHINKELFSNCFTEKDNRLTELAESNERQKKYLEKLCSQTATALVVVLVYDNLGIMGTYQLSGVKHIVELDESKKSVSQKHLFQVSDIDTAASICGIEVELSLPFDHKGNANYTLKEITLDQLESKKKQMEERVRNDIDLLRRERRINGKISSCRRRPSARRVSDPV